MKNLLLLLTLTLIPSIACALDTIEVDPGDNTISATDWAASLNSNFTEIDEDKVDVGDVDHAELSSDNFDMDGSGTALDPKVFTLKGFGDASNSTYPWKNATGTLSWVSIDGLSPALSEVTYSDEECTANQLYKSPTGVVICTSSGDLDLVATIADWTALTPTGHDIEDDFSTDTTGDYSAGFNGMTIVSETARGSAAWAKSWVYHDTSLGSNDMEVSADITYATNVNDGAGILIRHAEPAGTGYRVFFAAGSLYLSSYSSDADSAGTVVTFYAGSYTTDITYNVRATINGTAIKVYVDDTLVIDTTDSTYTAGNYCGMYWSLGSANGAEAVDNFWADAL